MEKKDLVNDFVQWISQTSGKPFPNNVFLKATLDDQATLATKTKFEGKPIMNHYSIKEMYHYLFSAWKSSSLMLLHAADASPATGSAINLRGVSVPQSEKERGYIQTILQQLEGICLQPGNQ